MVVLLMFLCVFLSISCSLTPLLWAPVIAAVGTGHCCATHLFCLPTLTGSSHRAPSPVPHEDELSSTEDSYTDEDGDDRHVAGHAASSSHRKRASGRRSTDTGRLLLEGVLFRGR